MTGAEFLWPSRVHAGPLLSTRQDERMMLGWLISIRLEPSGYGTHSMRRTRVAQIYKETDNLRTAQLLLGHRKMDSTVISLGVDHDDALSLSDTIDLQTTPPGIANDGRSSPDEGADTDTHGYKCRLSAEHRKAAPGLTVNSRECRQCSNGGKRTFGLLEAKTGAMGEHQPQSFAKALPRFATLLLPIELGTETPKNT